MNELLTKGRSKQSRPRGSIRWSSFLRILSKDCVRAFVLVGDKHLEPDQYRRTLHRQKGWNAIRRQDTFDLAIAVARECFSLLDGQTSPITGIVLEQHPTDEKIRAAHSCVQRPCKRESNKRILLQAINLRRMLNMTIGISYHMSVPCYCHTSGRLTLSISCF
jgi:hypothetical protein